MHTDTVVQESSKGLILDCCLYGLKKVGCSHNKVSSWQHFGSVLFLWKFENKNVILLGLLFRQEKKNLRQSIKKNRGQRLVRQHKFLGRKDVPDKVKRNFFSCHRPRPSISQITVWPGRKGGMHHHTSPSWKPPNQKFRCVRVVVCTWVGVHQQWISVQLHYPWAEGYLLACGPWGPPPSEPIFSSASFGLYDSCLCLHLLKRLHLLRLLSFPWCRQWWGWQHGAPQEEDHGLTPSVPGRRFCWPQEKLADQVWRLLPPSDSVRAGSGEAFKSLLHLHCFCFSPNLFLNSWIKSCELKFTELDFFPKRLLFYRK